VLPVSLARWLWHPGNLRDNIPMDGTMAGLMILAVLAGVGLLFLAERMVKKKKPIMAVPISFSHVLACIITGAVQVGVIQYAIKLAGTFDRTFVNGFHMPFFVGFAFFFVLLAAI
jgi:hypothetical protein